MAARTPVLAEKVPVVEPDATVTEAGTVKAALFVLASVTLVPPVAAPFDSVTVHVVEALDVRLVAAHCSEETAIGATSDRVAGVEDPLSVAVMVAV